MSASDILAGRAVIEATVRDKTPDTRRDLQLAEERVARATCWLRQCEGERDKHLARLLDSEGAHDRRFVAVR